MADKAVAAVLLATLAGLAMSACSGPEQQGTTAADVAAGDRAAAVDAVAGGDVSAADEIDMDDLIVTATATDGPQFDLVGASFEEPDEAYLVEFSHVTHTAARLKTACVDCHRLGLDGNRFRPSKDEMCTACHIDDGQIERFRTSLAGRPAPEPSTAPLEPIHRMHIYYDCSRCHDDIRLSQKVGDFPLPPNDNTSEACVTCHARAVRFSHAQHVAVDGGVGADCNFCHSPRPDGIQYSVPSHPQCWQCHDVSTLNLLEGCNLCHLSDARAPKTYNLERASILHKEHPRDQIPCSACHSAILTATSLEEIRAARLEASETSCQGCHEIPH